jgi:hypothetical protein
VGQFGFQRTKTSDQVAEIFAEPWRRNFQTHVNAWADFGHTTGRNQDAIKKDGSGPTSNRSIRTAARTQSIRSFGPAVEMRQRVTE